MAVARPHRRHFRAGARLFISDREKRSAILNLFRPRRLTEWIALALFLALLTGAVVSSVWLSRYAVAVHRLTRGIGDTVFYGADGQPWFRLDEQRHDVSLDQI
jgi:hypothetical protein